MTDKPDKSNGIPATDINDNIIDITQIIEKKKNEREARFAITIPSGELSLTLDDLKWFEENGSKLSFGCRRAMAKFYGEKKMKWPCLDKRIMHPFDLTPGAMYSNAWQERKQYPWEHPSLVKLIKYYKGRPRRKNVKPQIMVLTEQAEGHSWEIGKRKRATFRWFSENYRQVIGNENDEA